MMSEARISRVIAVIPAAVPTASASVGDMSNAIAATHRDRDAEEDRREHRTASEAAAETDRIRERLGRQQDDHDPRRVLADQAGMEA